LRQRQGLRRFRRTDHAIRFHSKALRVNLHLRHQIVIFHILLPNIPTILDCFDSFPETVFCDRARVDGCLRYKGNRRLRVECSKHRSHNDRLHCRYRGVRIAHLSVADHPAFDDHEGLRAEADRRPEHEVGQLAHFNASQDMAHTLRDGRVDSILADISRDMREQADVVETEFARRIAEMSDAMQKMIYNMRETLKAIAETEKKIDMLRASIRAKEAPLKVAQTRLNDRRARPGIESCHDPAQDHLIGEVYQLSQSVDSLTGELGEAESNLKKLRDDHQMLVKEIEMKKK